jgi:replicative DNA helicase
MSKGNTSKRQRPAEYVSNALIKVPPKSLEAEAAVLGAILLERDAIDRVIEIVSPDSFYSEAHKCIYKAIMQIYGENGVVDTITVMDKLTANGELETIGGPYYLVQLTKPVADTAHIEKHAMIIQQKYVKRSMGVLGAELHNASFDESIDDLEVIEIAEREISKIVNHMDKKNYANMSSLMVEFAKRTEALRANETDLVGVPTGFPALDRVTHGWRKTDLIILAARPSVGKTAFAINLARNAATHPTKPTKVGMFSLEMSKGQLVDRLVSMSSKIFLDKIITGRLNETDMSALYNKGIALVSNMPIFIDDTGGLNIFELRAKARRMVKKEKVGLIIIDYLQLMSGISTDKSINSRENEISHISRNLKALAKELDIPIIALSQLSRKVEERKVKEPMLSDLRESGAIEQDADMVMFLYRPEYYGINADEQGESTKGATYLDIAKHRNGALETIALRANLAIQEFTQDDTTMYRPALPAAAPEWKKLERDDEDEHSPF